jgi:hypothetical protein
VVGSVSYTTQSTLFSSPTSDHSSAQKSQPRNGAQEIFASAAGDMTRETVSVVNWIVCDAKKRRQTAANPTHRKDKNYFNINSLVAG